MGTQEPPISVKAEGQKTEGNGHWLCICQPAGFFPNLPLKPNRVRHLGQSQLFAGLLPLGFPDRSAAGWPYRPASFPNSGRPAKPWLSELNCSEAAVGDLIIPAMFGRPR